MKRTLIVLSFFAICKVLVAQNEYEDEDYNGELEYYKGREIKTLFGHDRDGGVYCAFTGGYSHIDEEQAILFGARFGWMAGHSIGVGLGATGFINEYHLEPSLGDEVFLAGGYGGLYIEPVILPRIPIHLCFPVLFGAGGISYVSREGYENNNFIEDSEAFLIIEPGAEIELNLTRFFRFSAGVSYRFPSSFDIGLAGTPGISAGSVKGISYTVALKFGRF